MKARSPRTCSPAVVTNAARHWLNGLLSGVHGVSSWSMTGSARMLFRDSSDNLSNRGTSYYSSHVLSNIHLRFDLSLAACLVPWPVACCPACLHYPPNATTFFPEVAK